jgi:solute carrier family 8 (sodium/calcium exchanger)
VKLFDAEPSAVKISKKDTCMVEIVSDNARVKQAEALQQLLERINRQENITWGQQFKDACMLHPSKNEKGEIEDVSGFDALLHFLSIGWKVLFACCPPPHWGGGVPCFVAAICFIGALTAVVGEVAGVMGCVMGLKPGVTAITFVAIGTSLPDTFASMTAAREGKYADAAVGNVTGSNSVNVFLGLGLPWVIAVIYSKQNNEEYKVPAAGLDLSVVLFLSCSLVGIAILIFRRCTVKGELGGSQAGRTASALIFVVLWLIYIVFSCLGQYGYISIASEDEKAAAIL